MQIVIDIPDILKEEIDNDDELDLIDMAQIMHQIKYGTPLPKGHDRLVEAKEVVKALFNHETIYDVPTIVKADKVESEVSHEMPKVQ